MNWDDFAEMAETEAATAPPEQLCPDGVHVAEIGWVKIQPKDWAKTDRNPEGMCLTVRLDIKKGIKAVWDSIPCDRRGSIAALCRSAGLAPPSGEWNESELRGRMVTAETVLRGSRRGTEYVAVAKYSPGPEPLPTVVRERANRTPTQKADAAAAMTDDDIPF